MSDELDMYVMGHPDGPRYAYGESWVAMALFMNDWPVFRTEEEAKRYWEEKHGGRKDGTKT